MSTPKWTPGPWSIYRETEVYSDIAGPGEYGHVASVEMKEDALFIITAPEMYEALKDAEKRLRGAGMLGGADDPVTAALAKARGDTDG